MLILLNCKQKLNLNTVFVYFALVLQNTSWQSLTPGTTVADYLSHLPANTLPLSLHHFLKYSAENIKKENQNVVSA